MSKSQFKKNPIFHQKLKERMKMSKFNNVSKFKPTFISYDNLKN